MAAEKKEKTIDGRKVEVTQFTGSFANKMFVRIQQCMDGRTVCVGPDEWQKFCIDFLAFTSVDNVQISGTENFDKVFTGAITFMMRVIEFVGEVNGFFDQSVSGDTKAAGTPKA